MVVTSPNFLWIFLNQFWIFWEMNIELLMFWILCLRNFLVSPTAYLVRKGKFRRILKWQIKRYDLMSKPRNKISTIIMLRTATIKTISVYSLCFQEVRFQKINRICKFNNLVYIYYNKYWYGPIFLWWTKINSKISWIIVDCYKNVIHFNKNFNFWLFWNLWLFLF